MKALLATSVLLLTACASAPEQKTAAPARENAPAMSSPCEALRELKTPAKNFAELDSDKDGKVPRSEYLCHAGPSFAARDRNRDHSLKGKETAGLKGADKDVSIIEFMALSEAAFDAADTNKDGVLDANEGKSLK